jgi:DNA-binding protein HU-beta
MPWSCTRPWAGSHKGIPIKTIRDAAIAGEEISLSGSGKFKVKATPERDGRNPSTGATIKIAAAKKLTFAPAKALKDSLNS